MNLAYTMTDRSGDLDLVLLALSEHLAELGWKTAGVVQVNTDRKDCHRCDMDVRVLPHGPTIRISQSLGKEAKGCRLDPQSLEVAVGLAGARLRDGADVLIVNKFGKHEADGRGFRPLVAEAIELGIPVLVGLNTIHDPAFQNFTGGLAQALAPEVNALTDWIETCATPSGAVAGSQRSADTNAA